jgi:hypothetical protein
MGAQSARPRVSNCLLSKRRSISSVNRFLSAAATISVIAGLADINRPQVLRRACIQDHPAQTRKEE